MNLYVTRSLPGLGHICSGTNVTITNAENKAVGYCTPAVANYLVQKGIALDLTIREDPDGEWEASTVNGPGPDDITVLKFTHPEQWRKWLAANHSTMLGKNVYHYVGENVEQYGTGYYWSMIKRVK